MVCEHILKASPRPNGWKIDYNTIFKDILNLKGHPNPIASSRVTTILVNGWIFPLGQSGEASQWRVCYQQGLSSLVSLYIGRNEGEKENKKKLFAINQVGMKTGQFSSFVRNLKLLI